MRRAALFTVVLCVSLACDSGDDSGDDVADSAGTESTDSDGATSDTTAGDTTSGVDPWDFPPAVCGAVTCGQGQLCVIPGEYCDYGQSPPIWIQPASECASVPPSCADLQDPELENCLWETLCESMGEQDFWPAVLEEGTLSCPQIGLDCFE